MTHKETARAVDQQQVEPGKKSDLDSLLDAIKAHVDRGFDRIQEQNFEDAIGYFDEAIRLDRRAARAFHGRAQSWHSLKETESALSDYDEAIRLDPKVARAFFNRGRLRLERRETGEAIADYNKLLNEMDGLRPDADVLFILTTNRPESLEMALASRPGRVDQAIEFPLPDGEGRAELIRL